MQGVDSESPPPPGLPADVTVISIHPMYSSGQVTLATFLGGPLGGACLMGLNYKRLGEPAKARRTIGLGVLAMAALIAIGFATGGPFTLVLAIAPIIVLNMLASSLQGAAYDRHVAVGGSRGSSWRAAGLGVASLVIYLAAIVGGVAIRVVVTRPDKVMIGESSVFYTDGVPRAEAQRVGEELVALKELRRDAKWSFEVTRDGDRRVVAFVMKDTAFSKDEIQERRHRLAEPLSRDVYDGAPVDIWLIDAALQPHVKLPWESRPRKIDRDDPAQTAAREQKACDGGDMKSCTNLGVLYARGTGVVRDDARAAALYQKACDGGAMKGCFDLGMLYEDGTGVVRDAAKAAALYQKACDGGATSGCSGLAGLYIRGLGVVKDAVTAAALFQKACDGGDMQACSNLGAYYQSTGQGTGMVQNAAKAAALFQKACDGGDRLGCTNLGALYTQGTGVAHDAAKAAALFQRSCDRGEMLGCSNLGVLYAQGTGVVQDAVKAAALYQTACDGGEMKGCYNLGVLYAQGTGVGQDATRAAALYQKACDGGTMIGCVNVGYLYEQGIGVARDAAKAAAAYRKACDGGEALGCSRSRSPAAPASLSRDR